MAIKLRTSISGYCLAHQTLKAGRSYLLMALAAFGFGCGVPGPDIDIELGSVGALEQATSFAGVDAIYYQDSSLGCSATRATLDGQSADWSGVMAGFHLGPAAPFDRYAYRYKTRLNIDNAGLYTFYLRSDDASQLDIDGTLVVDNNGCHGAQERSGAISLSAGSYLVEVRFAERTGSASLEVSWQGPGFSKTPLEGSVLSVCGTAVVSTGEGCDDGNATDGDGCNVECLKENGEGCSVDTECASERCEANICSAENVCGNGIVESSNGETCDDGDTIDTGNGCSNTCEDNSVCGDGIVQSLFESCDDGDTIDAGDGCSADCQVYGIPGSGQTQTSAGASCWSILLGGHSSGDGLYWIDPYTPGNFSDAFLAYCDMTTDGGGWTLLLNYVHQGSTRPATRTMQNNLPHLQGDTLGDNESGDPQAWGHASNVLVDAMQVHKLRFYGRTSGHSRVIHFTTESDACIRYFETGIGQCSTVRLPGHHQLLADHSAIHVPVYASSGWSSRGNGAMTEFPLYRGGQGHWSVGRSHRWEVDDYPNGDGNDTIHRIWAKHGAFCGNGHVDEGEGCDDGNTVDDGNGCSETCLLKPGQTCTSTSDCIGGFTCDLAEYGSGTCEPESTCGNGVVDVGEVCDDGNTQSDNNGCSSTCANSAVCGNGRLEALFEQCDDGDSVDTGNGCDAFCGRYPVAGDGSSQGFAAKSCYEIKQLHLDVGDGDYWIDPLTPGDTSDAFLVTCDMSTDGGGWTLVANYVHRAGTVPSVIPLSRYLPRKQSDTLGDNESGHAAHWGHADTSLFNALGTTELRFYARSGHHPRVIDFATDHPGCIDYFSSGVGSCNGVQSPSAHRLLNEHTATNIPQNVTGFQSNRSHYAMTYDPFYRPNESYWSIRGGGNQYAVDDSGVQNGAYDTIHRVWVRHGAFCGNGVIEDGEGCDDGNTSDDGNGCTALCKLSLGQSCDDANDCDPISTCDLGSHGSTQCEALSQCSNGLIEIGEDCDDGNALDDGNGCSATCLNQSVCGDGIVQSVFEECDDGNAVDDGNGCDNACQRYDVPGDGSRQNYAGLSCFEILQKGFSRGDGVYWIDIETPGDTSDAIEAYCDMSTAGGGWTLILNYTRKGGTSPGRSVLSDRLPLLAGQELGDHDAGNILAWGHTGYALLGDMKPTELWVHGESSAHSRIVSFTTDHSGCIDYFSSGNGNCHGIENNHVALAGHSAVHIPQLATGEWSHRGNSAMTEYPFYRSGQAYWVIGRSNQWEIDGDQVGYSADTMHRIWARHGEFCGNGVVESGEGCDDGNRTDDGNGCTATCKLALGQSCSTADECDATLVCDQGILGSMVCEAENTCGNGQVELGEDCDDGNTMDDGNGCGASCLNTAFCGDGVIQDVFEECDDGNGFDDGNGCDALCARYPVAGGGLDQAHAGISCSQIKTQGFDAGDGVYWIDPFTPGDFSDAFEAYCDMSTDGGGWTLALNYLHKGGTNPARKTFNSSLPLLGEISLGGDESSSTSTWGHPSNALFDQLDVSEMRFVGLTSHHGRKIHFKTDFASCIQYFASGVGSCYGLQIGEMHHLLGDHSANYIPHQANGFWSNQGNAAMLNFPFYRGGISHWSIGRSNRWEVDNQTQYGHDTHHQIWVRHGAFCGNGVVEGDEGCDDGNVADDGNGCSATCAVQEGYGCERDAHCELGLVCNTGVYGSGLCEVAGTCGNGAVELGEDCDDGNIIDDGNGCSQTCLANHTCGDGVVENLFEQCDDGNTVDDGDGCNGSCWRYSVPGDGSAQSYAAVSCNEILVRGFSVGDGVYWIDPMTPGDTSDAFQAYCDMNTDGGGWTMVLNYVHKGGTTPARNVKTDHLPLLQSETLGDDESSTVQAWGHSSNALFDALDVHSMRFYAKTSAHNKIIHFTTDLENCINYFGTGGGSCTSLNYAGRYRLLADHTAQYIPQSAPNFETGAGQNAMTYRPFRRNNLGNWNIHDWEVDNESTVVGQHDTIHRIFVRHGSFCGDGVIADSEGCDDGNTTDDGNGCSSTCKLTIGQSCQRDIECQAGLICDGGINGSGSCEFEDVCGNGRLDAGEDCDDGNTLTDGNGCSDACAQNNVCGDGVVESMFEVCDDGNTSDDGNGCTGACTRYAVMGDGSSQAYAGLSCLEIHRKGLSYGDGLYWIDPKTPGDVSDAMQVYCDMSTDGGGWTLVMNYVHEGGTLPTLNARTATLPILGSSILGDDESDELDHWGHSSAELFKSLDVQELRFFGRSSSHNRILHFATNSRQCIDYFGRDGSSNCSVNSAVNHRLFPDHTAIYIPQQAYHRWSNQGDYALTHFPFYRSGNGHWVAGRSHRWEVDDKNGSGGVYDTIHRAWARHGEFCGNGVLEEGEGCDDGNREDDGNGCSTTCKVSLGYSCTQDASCDTGLVCDNGLLGSKTCETAGVCGDGHLDGLEDCDDGNTADDGNGCGGDCLKTSVCGDGILSPFFEDCDDGDAVDSGNGCRADCSRYDVPGDGRTQGHAALSCAEILAKGLSGGDGLYWVDPLTPGDTSDAFEAYCDMSTDGGGWTLVLNYVHKGGTNPSLRTRNVSLPLLGVGQLGDDESSELDHWGHASAALMESLEPNELRIYGQSSAHGRVVHFKTSMPGCLDYFSTGVGSCSGLHNDANHQLLPDHTATVLPFDSTRGYTNQGDRAMTTFPFYKSGSAHWSIRASNRWEVDDYVNGYGADTIHRVWVRHGAFCGNGRIDEAEGCDDGNRIDDGNGCSLDCKLTIGQACLSDADCESGSLCDTASLGSYTCEPANLCGDGHIGAGEDCDDGNAFDDGNGCSAACVGSYTCGDGFVSSAFEQCDDGNASDDGNGCDENCLRYPIAGDGSSKSFAAISCDAILRSGLSRGDGVYWIDPLTPGNTDDAFEAYCDMSTDGGGWTLVLNYLHRGYTSPALSPRTNNLPLLSGGELGDDDSLAPVYWGHARPSLFAELGVHEMRFFAESANHDRKIHFTTQYTGCIDYFASGNGNCGGINDSANHRVLTDHTASSLPQLVDNIYSHRGDYAMTAYPFYRSGVAHWNIQYGGQWLVDDVSVGSESHTHHQIWVRHGSRCGNSVVESGETCDDGNLVDDLNGCSSTCQRNDICGDGIIQSLNEVCDDGNAVDDGNGCNDQCQRSGYCGDGLTQVLFEQCDDSDQFDSGNGCSSTCLRNDVCGDSAVQAMFESCDDGDAVDNGDGCDENCQSYVYCGNGIVDGGEACDDGNTIDDGNGCSSTCQRNDVCGDGTIQSLYEQCDDGTSADESNGCSSTCQRNDVCGDGVTQSLYEQCDDGNVADNGNGCSAICSRSGMCGDGIVQSLFESCDDGDAFDSGNGCSSTCQRNDVCGDGVTQAHFETCDDGNGIDDGNGCSAECQRYDVCGDGIVQSLYEGCDDGDAVDTGNGCSAGCTIDYSCGNGVVESLFESCDDGDAVDSGNGCSATCQRNSDCGDGVVQSLFETCDDGDVSDSGNGCSSTCQRNDVCGDSVVQSLFEGCDDGDVIDSGNGCDAACQRDGACGNGQVESVFETCDDGDAIDSGNGCSANCQRNDVCGDSVVQSLFEGCDDGNTTDDANGCTASCQSVNLCGDGVVQTAVETCDDGDTADTGNGCSATCQRYDACGDGTTHSLFEDCDDGNTTDDGNGCSAGCQRNDVCGDTIVQSLFETCDDGDTHDNGNGCTVNCQKDAICGDGRTQSLYEQCDDGNTEDDGNGCNADCERNDVCGDGDLAELFEECDDGDTIDSGNGCDASCRVQGVCGNGVHESLNEECDDGNLSAGDGCDVQAGCKIETGWQCQASPCIQMIEICGDGRVVGNESCDDGNGERGDGCDDTSAMCMIESGWQCGNVPCTAMQPLCGDGHIVGGETCDDGDTIDSNNGCSSTCARDDVCGDGVVQSLFESCDDGNTEDDGNGCSATCTAAAGCGNNIVDAGEQCDDGNDDDTDGCSACALSPGYSCADHACTQLQAVCGDGIVVGLEQCDDANRRDADGCSSSCRLESGYRCLDSDVCTVVEAVCGDSLVVNQESCDDGNASAGDGCSERCGVEEHWVCLTQPCISLGPICGDGYVLHNEECDDGNGIGLDGCSARCQIEEGFTCDPIEPGNPQSASRCGQCGDGLLQVGEMCDDGNNTDDGNGCSKYCERNDICGNGVIESLYEDCDDGNLEDSDGCRSDCQPVDGFRCEGEPSVCTLVDAPDDLEQDTDGDGVPDSEELMLGTDPTSADSDGDGISDGDEIALGTNPLAKFSVGGGSEDTLPGCQGTGLQFIWVWALVPLLHHAARRREKF